ncbi:MAG: hypothetical protein OEW35_07840 [Gammaproteobacteria bacterium]|nr:hypothetical protein [Gammaproteobacteria bacterium]MDH4253821.1 hypothetical protein [Gammaproteobacteria bacterium]MDH5311053.1 hypothetical protein [Gammaproteobacteria bacterium]
MITRLACLPAALLVAMTARADAEDFEGQWTLTLTDAKRELVGLLEIEKHGEEWRAFLEGGPARVEIDDQRIVLWADSRDVRGFVFDRRMEGSLAGGTISGRYEQEGAAAQRESGGPWRAERYEPALPDSETPKPFEISGTWTATQALDFRKYTMALTPAGEEWLEGYMPYYDQPDVRCASIGLPALATYTFPFEVIASENRLTFLYEYQEKVRRVWMDGRQPSDYMPPSRMGHSNGRWKGNTLVIDTTNLERTVRDFRGELISENARIEERYTLSDDGSTLTAVITVYDPEYYERPPVRRRQWKRDDGAEIFPYTCDPDSFYISMFEEGEMEMYIERADRRF